MNKTSNGVNTILSAIEEICREKKLSKEQVLEAIEQALASAYRKDFGNKMQNLKVEFDPDTGKMKVFDEKTVVEDLPEPSSAEASEDEPSSAEATEGKEEEKNLSSDLSAETLVKEETLVKDERRFNPKTEIQISEIKKTKKKVKIGDVIKTPLEIPANFGRIAAQTAKQVIVQKLREAEREAIYEKYKGQEGKVINGIIQGRERQIILIDLGEISAILPLSEQIREERYLPDQKIKVYVVSVNKTPKGPEIIVSRRHAEVLKELFKLEIPEIANGVVEIKAIAREAGARSKVAVWTKEETVDPVGACIGQRGVRIQTVIAEIGGEKIDIIEYDESPEKFVINALAPAKVASLKINEKQKTALAKVIDNQLSLAIGRNGQNVRLAAKLTGWRIDIQEEKPSSSLSAASTPEDASAKETTEEDKKEKKNKKKEEKNKDEKKVPSSRGKKSKDKEEKEKDEKSRLIS